MTSVGLSSSLASLELLKVPVADLHVATLLIHAPSEVLRRASAVIRLVLVVVVVGLVVLLLDGSSSGCLGRCRRATAEHAANGMADGGAYCDTAGQRISFWFERWERDEAETYAAVLAIWPNRPGPWEGAAIGGA